MPRRRLVAPFALALLALFVSCFQGAKAPQVTPARTLALGALGPDARDDAASASKRPFAVVFAGPRGATVDPSEVTIVFNRPMRPMELAGEESAPPASIAAKGVTGAAAPKGTWRWIGTSALVFAPDPALPRATEYAVTVPPGTKALDGSTLETGYTFAFSTPPPSLVRIDPPDGDRQLLPTSTFALRFNQPVEPREVARATKLLVGAGDQARAVPIHASWPKSDTKTLVKITPSRPLPLDTPVRLVVDKSLRGVEGPLPIGTTREVRFATYGPLTVSGVECSTSTPHRKCAAQGYVSFTLSNRVSRKEIAAHVRVEGAPPIAWGSRAEEGKTQYVSLEPKLRPASAYAVVITAGMKDEHGQALARDVRLPFETDDEWPALQIGVAGSTFEAPAAAGGKHGRARDVPIGAVNVPSYELLTATLDEPALAKWVLTEHKSKERWSDARRLRGAKLETVRPDGEANATSVKMVRLDELLAPRKGRGAVIVGARHETVRGKPFDDERLLAVTDLGITAKMSRFGSVVWVTRLSDGAPVASAVVSVRGADREIFVTRTDGNGVATIPPDAYVPVDASGAEDRAAILVARLGDDWTWRRVSDALSPWQYAPSSDPSGRLTPFGMLFTDRGIYKTGEAIELKAIFRAPLAKGTATPKGRAVTIEAYDSNDTKVFSQATRLGDFGAVAAKVPIPASARLGTMELRAQLAPEAGDGGGTATATVQIAAYRPAEFKVGVETDKPSYVRGDKASFVVRGDYLFGAPMSGGKVRFTVTRGAGWFQPPGSDGLVLDDDAYAWALTDAVPRAGEVQSGEGALDAKGSFAGATALALPHQRGAEVVSIEAEVEDVSRQTIAGRASVVVHPGEVYAALAPPKEMFVAKGANLRPTVAAIEPSGRRRAGMTVHVDLIRRTWQSVMEASGEDGHYESRVVDTIVGGCDAVTTATTAACDLAANEPGYFVLRASTKDRRGNVVAASAPVYVLGEGEGIGWRLDDTSKLEVVTDKKTYEVGDTATILVKSPFPQADALVTIERAGVYETRRMALAGAMPTIRVPITDALRPNVFVSVHLVRGRTKDAPARGADVGAPAFRLGYAELTVNPEARRLKVAIAPARRDYRPGETVDADVVVTDRAGRPARGDVTFYAVDEGVLMLTGYKTPDPIPVFTAPRPLAVFSLESREDLARVLLTASGAGVDKGDEGGGGGGVREDFRSTAFFAPSIVTDDRGRAHVRFALPDSLTTYRLMAVVAAEDDRFGFGEAQVTTSRPLMARPNLPRFLRAGDEVEAGIVVSSKGLPATNVEVAVEASGVQLRGDAKRALALPANGSVEVRWAIAAPTVGRASFTFHVRAGDQKDDVKVAREVEEPISPEAVALYGETTTASGEKLGDLSAMRPDVGGLDVRLASTALVGLDDGVEQLIEYPYGCTEQLTSRLVPFVPLRALAADYGIALPADVGAIVEKAIAKIVQNQREDGGFGWWPDARDSDPWVSAYALWGLDLAHRGGAFLPDGVLENATRYVRRELERLLREGHVELSTAAFMLDVLAAVGQPDPGYANRLYEKRAELPLFARALLAHAMATSKMDPKQAEELTRDLEAHLRVTPAGATVVENLGDAYAVLLDSEARTTAMAIRALVAIDPRHPLAARLAKGLLAMRKGGRWRSTQETAWALLALDDYRRAQERTPPSFDANVFLEGALLFQAPFHGRSVTTKSASFAASKLFAAGASGATLAFQVNGSGTLFYEARLRYARKELPTSGIDRGFTVRKLVRSVRPEGLAGALATLPRDAATRAAAGDLVLVDLLVVTPDPREQVVIDDPLPAGLEAVDAKLATTARSLDVTDAGGAADRADEEASDDDAIASGRAWGSAWYHREIHDDRVLTFVEHMPAGMFHYRYLARATTFGRFVVPPTRAECMYEPETFGRTGATTFEVRAR